MLYTSNSEPRLKILTIRQILSMLNKIYIRLSYGTQVEQDIAFRYIRSAREELKSYWNIHE